jgi:hypothetical protein
MGPNSTAALVWRNQQKKIDFTRFAHHNSYLKNK